MANFIENIDWARIAEQRARKKIKWLEAVIHLSSTPCFLAGASIALAIIVLVAILNFVAFFVIGIAIGGDALNGKVVDGPYYLYGHGKLNEVSPGFIRL